MSHLESGVTFPGERTVTLLAGITADERQRELLGVVESRVRRQLDALIDEARH